MVARLVPLSWRERQVLECLADGMYDREIAAKLFISRETVKKLLHRMYWKLGARNRTHAVAIAYRHGLLAPKEPDGQG